MCCKCLSTHVCKYFLPKLLASYPSPHQWVWKKREREEGGKGIGEEDSLSPNVDSTDGCYARLNLLMQGLCKDGKITFQECTMTFSIWHYINAATAHIPLVMHPHMPSSYDMFQVSTALLPSPLPLSPPLPFSP